MPRDFNKRLKDDFKRDLEGFLASWDAALFVEGEQIMVSISVLKNDKEQVVEMKLGKTVEGW